MSLFTPTWHTEKAGVNALGSEPEKPEEGFSGLIGEESEGIYPRIPPPAPNPAGTGARVLPLPPELRRRAVPADSLSCPTCRGTAFWISLAGVRICERCHPPADARIVARREKGSATSPPGARTETSPTPAIPPEDGAA